MQSSSGEEILFITSSSHTSELQTNSHLNWVDIVSDDDKLSFLLLDQLGDGVAAGSQVLDLLGWCLVLSGDLSFGLCLQAGGLLQLRLWAVFLQELEELNGGLLVECLRELVDCWGHLQSLLQDSLVALDADVLGPSDEARQIALGLDILA